MYLCPLSIKALLSDVTERKQGIVPFSTRMRESILQGTQVVE